MGCCVLCVVCCVVCCVLCVVCCVLCGVWCVWCVVCGVWCVVCGVWCVVCGVWCVVCGVRGKIGLVLGLHISDGEASSCLHADNGTEMSLGLDDAIRDATGLAQAWQPHDHLNRVHIVRDDDELGLLLLNKCGDMVD